MTLSSSLSICFSHLVEVKVIWISLVGRLRNEWCLRIGAWKRGLALPCWLGNFRLTCRARAERLAAGWRQNRQLALLPLFFVLLAAAWAGYPWLAKHGRGFPERLAYWWGQGRTPVGQTASEPTDLADEQARERLAAVESGLLKLQQDSAAYQQSLLSYREELKGAIAEVARNNDILDRERQALVEELNKRTLIELGSLSPLADISSSQVGDSKNQVSGQAANQASLINLNEATLSQLDSLPGIGPAYAQRIIDYRQEKGPFKKVDDLLEVQGIGQALLEKIRALVGV